MGGCGKKPVKTSIVIIALLLTSANVFAKEKLITSKKLSIEDVQFSFEKHINNHGFRNGLKIEKFMGVNQEGKKATVFYSYRGIGYMMGSPFSGQLGESDCSKFNDESWFCRVNLDRLKISFYLEHDVFKSFVNAIDKKSISAVRYLLSEGADINIRDNTGSTPLMYAALHSTPKIVRFLLNKGADVSVQDNHNKTALNYAKERNQTPVILLIKTKLDSLFKDLLKGLQESMVLVKGGCFEMGDTFGDGGSDEKPVHEVCLSDYYIGRYEVTQREWEKIMAANPSKFRDCGPNCPVEQVSWIDVQEYISKLNALIYYLR